MFICTSRFPPAKFFQISLKLTPKADEDRSVPKRKGSSPKHFSGDHPPNMFKPKQSSYEMVVRIAAVFFEKHRRIYPSSIIIMFSHLVVTTMLESSKGTTTYQLGPHTLVNNIPLMVLKSQTTTVWMVAKTLLKKNGIFTISTGV